MKPTPKLVKLAAHTAGSDVMFDDESFWRNQSDEAKHDGAALLAFGAYAGVRLSRVKELRAALRKLVFAARTSGGVAGRDDFLCAACEEAEILLNEV